MNIGQLDRRITIEQSTETQSAYGDMSISYFIDEVLHHGRKKWTQLKAKIKV